MGEPGLAVKHERLQHWTDLAFAACRHLVHKFAQLRTPHPPQHTPLPLSPVHAPLELLCELWCCRHRLLGPKHGYGEVVSHQWVQGGGQLPHTRTHHQALVHTHSDTFGWNMRRRGEWVQE